MEPSDKQQTLHPVSLSLTVSILGSFGVAAAAGQTSQVYFSLPSPQGSSSSDSLEGQSCDYASKSYDAVVFDVLKVTPEEFAVSDVELVWLVVLEEVTTLGSCPG